MSSEEGRNTINPDFNANPKGEIKLTDFSVPTTRQSYMKIHRS